MKDKVATVRDFYTMPFMAFFILIVGFYGLIHLTTDSSNNFIQYNGGYDVGFLIGASYILINHLLAFSLVPLLALRKKITKEGKTIFITFAIITIVLQLMSRLLSIGTSHLSCGNQCVSSIMPLELDFQLFVYTAIALIIAFILFLKAFNKKMIAS